LAGEGPGLAAKRDAKTLSLPEGFDPVEFRTTLGGLACPTLALVQDADAPASKTLSESFDIAVGSHAEMVRAVEAIRQTPIAATALVQLLRGAGSRSIEESLVAESFVYSMLQAGPEFARWLAGQRTLRPEIPEMPPVKVERDGGRIDVILNHPMKRNAYSAAMRDALCEALQLVLADDSIAEVVLRGEGAAFCSGGDLDEFGLLVDPATAHTIRTTRNAGRLLERSAKRIRAELHGACVGAGVELPAFAGTVVATPDAWFQLPELAMGLIPGAGGTASLPPRIGIQATAWLALSGERLDADRALALGLVDEIREAPSGSAD
jgi:enoyl-CoA hydratase